MQNTVGAMTLFVADKRRAKEFYGRVFELEPLFEDDTSVAFRFENTLVNLVVEHNVAELIAPATVGAGTRALYTIWVDDCDATVALVRGRGVDFPNGPVDRPWGQRTAVFVDPDGHAWEIAQALPS
ncbi:MAG TPA: VOC family protein [Gaiellaceae bacterium]|nr:VOC family protein [Gaiellaceae bacterium]